MDNFKEALRQKINDKGMKLIFVSERTGIPYQRLNRIFNQDALMSASELLSLCWLLDIDPNSFIHNKAG